MHKKFRYQKFSEAQKGFLTKFFGTARQKTFDRKSGYQDLCIKFFDTRNFLKNRRVPSRNSAVLLEKLNGKMWYLHHNRLPPPSPHTHKKFHYLSFYETEKGFCTKFFGTVRQKFSTESRHIPFWCIKVFRYPNIFGTRKGSSTKCFGSVREKTFDRKVRYQDLCIKFFDTRNFLTNRRVPLRNAAVLREKLNGKSWYLHHNRLPPHLLRIKNFNTWIFMKHKKVSPRNFSVLWNNKPRQKIVIYPSYA